MSNNTFKHTRFLRKLSPIHLFLKYHQRCVLSELEHRQESKRHGLHKEESKQGHSIKFPKRIEEKEPKTDGGISVIYRVMGSH